MASLVKKCRHPRPAWEACGCTWYVRERSGGRELYTPVGADRKAAERALARLRARPEETLEQAVDLWLAAKRRDPDARRNSLASYDSRAARVRAYFGATRVRALHPEDLTLFVADLLEAGLAPATVQAHYALLTSTLRHAQRRGVIRHLPLPADGPGIPTPKARRHDLSLAQVEEVVGRMAGVWGRVAELILLTGLRWGEAVAIEPGDVQGRIVHVRRTVDRYGGRNAPKTTRGDRPVPLSRRAATILGTLDLPVGGDYRQARLALVAAMGELHRPGMGWHTIRNAHATLLDAAGVSVRDQAARMGHGEHFAQTLAYGLASQAGSADALDRVRQRAARPSGSRAGVARLDEARARRRSSP